MLRVRICRITYSWVSGQKTESKFGGSTGRGIFAARCGGGFRIIGSRLCFLRCHFCCLLSFAALACSHTDFAIIQKLRKTIFCPQLPT